MQDLVGRACDPHHPPRAWDVSWLFLISPALCEGRAALRPRVYAGHLTGFRAAGPSLPAIYVFFLASWSVRQARRAERCHIHPVRRIEYPDTRAPSPFSAANLLGSDKHLQMVWPASLLEGAGDELEWRRKIEVSE